MDQEKNKNYTREFKLSSYSIDNKTVVFVLTFMIFVFGVFTYIVIPKESYPEVVIPTIYVGTPYNGNPPVDIENLITRPIEKELQSISGVKDINSTSVQDYSSIIIEFNPDTEIPKALQDVKDAVDRAKRELPNDLDTDPSVMDIDLTEMPIMFVNISGNYSINELKSFGEYLEEEIEKFSEISKCEVRGAREREIRIDADIHKMEAMQVSFSDIQSAIANANVTLSGGNILSGDFRRSLRVDGEFKTVNEIKKVIVKDEDQRIVYVEDIANVTDSYEERKSFARNKLEPVVTLDVVKRGGENLILTAEKINKVIEKAKRDRFPDNLEITITNDQSKFTKSMVANLENSIITSMILVVLVLMFFMGLRNALFVGIAIPLSMFMSFMILGTIGYSANMMVLFGLILALGMLVDNGIVVVENIYRLMQEGLSPIKAAKEGVGEVAWPIITSTMTTLAAFVPLAFWQGIMGEFMKYLPITLIIVLSSSLFVALVINPMLTSVYMRLEEKKMKKKAMAIIVGILVACAFGFYFIEVIFLGNIIMLIAIALPFTIFILNPSVNWFQNKLIPFLENVYSNTIDYALHGKRPLAFLIGTVVLLVATFMLLGVRSPKVNLFAPNEPNFITVLMEEPIGYDIESTNEFCMKVEKDIIDIMQKYDIGVESIIAKVGEGASDPNQFVGAQATPNKAMINISFFEYEKRGGVNTQEAMDEIRDLVQKYPGVEITVDKDAVGPPVGKPINIEISGENYEKLISVSNMVKKAIENSGVRGLEELKSDLETGKPEMLIQIDRDKAQRLGLSTGQVASELRTALFGLEISKFKDGEDDYPIQLRLKDEYRYDVDALINKRVTFRDNKGNLKQIPISSIADIKYSSTYGSVKRKDLDRVISLYSNVLEGYNGNEIVNELKLILDELNFPEGYDYKFTGEQEEQAESGLFLAKALAIAVFSIFLIIVAQFNSLTAPFIIMASVLFSTIGVFLGLVVFNMDFIIIMTGIGIISLAGVVVNNAIVLIDYTNLVRKRRRIELGLGPNDRLPYHELLESIKVAGKTRLRPVLLTAITTVLGLVPMAIGLNIDYIGFFTQFDANLYMGGDNVTFWGPMAWTVIFGLTFATFLTLVIVPVMYLLADIAGAKYSKTKS